MYGYRDGGENPFVGRHRALILRLALLVLLSVALMILDHRHQQLDRLHDALSLVLLPIQWSVDAPFSALRWTRESLSNRGELLRENRELREENLRIRGELQRLVALQTENERLRELLQSSRRLDEHVVVAEIMSVDMNPYRHQIVLNRGRRNHAYQGQALIDAHGVLGQITHAGPLHSTGLLITDPNHSIPVEINRNGLRTIVQGTGDTSRLELPYLPVNADIRSGDLLVSSGLAGRFPRGYPVGIVDEVEIVPGERFARISAHPAARVDRSREVLLVINQPETTEVPDDEAGKPAQPGAEMAP